MGYLAAATTLLGVNLQVGYMKESTYARGGTTPKGFGNRYLNPEMRQFVFVTRFGEEMGAVIRDEQTQTHGRNHPRNRNDPCDYNSKEDAEDPHEIERNTSLPPT